MNLTTLNRIPTFRKKMAYIPFKGGVGGPRIGLAPLPKDKPWFEFDEDKEVQLELKKKLLWGGNAECFKSTQDSLPAQTEATDLLKGFVHTASFYSISRYVQDDLCIMEKRDGEWRLTAASVCFPTGWELHHMFNKTVHELHEDVADLPFRDVLSNKLDQVTEEIQWRLNWFLYARSDLRHDYPNTLEHRKWIGVDKYNIGSNLFIRYERQTIRKLPKTGALLFTIRVYVDPLRTLKEEHREHIPDFIKAYQKHKVDGPWVEPMLEYLEG